MKMKAWRRRHVRDGFDTMLFIQDGAGRGRRRAISWERASNRQRHQFWDYYQNRGAALMRRRYGDRRRHPEITVVKHARTSL